MGLLRASFHLPSFVSQPMASHGKAQKVATKIGFVPTKMGLSGSKPFWARAGSWTSQQNGTRLQAQLEFLVDSVLAQRISMLRKLALDDLSAFRGKDANWV